MVGVQSWLCCGMRRAGSAGSTSLSLAHPRGTWPPIRGPRHFKQTLPLRINCSGSSAQTIATAECAPSDTEDATYIKRTVQRGEEVYSPQTVVILGDCKPGSIIRSDGDIIVLGRLMGSAHAGQAGNHLAFISASDMQPSSLQIANVRSSRAAVPWLHSNKHSKLAYLEHAAPSAKHNNSTKRATPADWTDNRLWWAAEPQPPSASPALRGAAQPSQRTAERAEMKVVPLARPYLGFGPSFPELIKSASAQRMRSAGTAAMVTWVYATIAGALLMCMPARVLSILFDVSQVSTGFIRLGGAMLALFGQYYLGAARGGASGSGLRGFYLATVWGRVLLFAVCCWIYVMGELGWGVLVLGGLNLLGAISMKLALDRDAKALDAL